MLHLLAMFSVDIRVIQYSIRVLLLFALYTALRILFVLFNLDQFESIALSDFIIGLRYDAVAIALWGLPFHVLSLIGIWWNAKWIQKLQEWFLLFSVFLAILLSAIDFKYFEFTLKRTTSDVSSFFTGNAEIWSLLPQLATDFWYVFFLAALMIYGSYKLFASTSAMNIENFGKGNRLANLFFSFLILSLYVLMARGGTQLIPLQIISATKYTSPTNVPIVLNTPFTVAKTLGKSTLEPVEYFNAHELNNRFNPVISPELSDSILPKQTNVVLITLESFSNLFVRHKNKAYLTPFFNELKSKSLSFEQCFANGKKSIEGIPSIYSGIPTLSEHPIITGTYSSNKINSLASYLKKVGYSTSFFHGGRNGTMSFESYTARTGFDKYYGLNEYPNEDDFDGTWGIFDEPYYSFFIDELNKTKEPFFSGFFSLSSHHPYTIPTQYRDRFSRSKDPMENAIAYADYALSTFFENAKKQPWYKNTLFVLTADHTTKTKDKLYGNELGQYSIPLLFFHPSDTALYGTDSSITQQTDILPSVLDYIGFNQPFFSFGQSCFNDNQKGFSIQYLNGIYQIIQDGHLLQFSNEEVIGLFNINKDPNLKNDLSTSELNTANALANKLKAVIQQYNNRVIENRLSE